MKKTLFCLVAVTSLFWIHSTQSCQSSKASASKLLRFNLEKGRGYDYEMIWDMNQEVMGQDLKINVSAGYSIDILDDDGNTKTMSAVYNAFKMNMQVMGMEINVDTNQPAPQLDTSDMKGNPAAMSAMMNKLFSGIKGKKFTMKVNKEGEVIEVLGFDKIAEAMADSMGLPEEGREKMKEMAAQRFNGDDIKKNFSQLFYIFPNKEVKIGDSWEKDFQIGSGEMPAKYNTTYTVKDIEGDIITLNAKTDIESGSEAIKIKGEQTGKLLVDSKSGLVLNADFDMDLKTSVAGKTMDLKGKGKIKGKARQ